LFEQKQKTMYERRTMMKKLLVLSLVLGMASLASAALTLVVNGQDAGAAITLMPSDTIWIGINQSETRGFAAYVIMTVPAPGEWTGQSRVNSAGFPGTVPGWTYYGTAVDPSLDAWFYNGSIATVDPFPTGVHAEVQFHCKAQGDVIITLYNEAFAAIDTLTIHQIPEPATMALLGLGALVLRRKK
jgi:hypothetical protein